MRNDLTPCLSMLAYHYHAARPIGPAAKAYEYARRAAQRADELFAFEEAAHQYQLAMQAIEPGMDMQRCELLLALGEVQNKMGDSANAVASFTAAAEIGSSSRFRALARARSHRSRERYLADGDRGLPERGAGGGGAGLAPDGG